MELEKERNTVVMELEKERNHVKQIQDSLASEKDKALKFTCPPTPMPSTYTAFNITPIIVGTIIFIILAYIIYIIFFKNKDKFK